MRIENVESGATTTRQTPWQDARKRWRTPVAILAVVGVVAIVVQAWILGRWALDGGIRAVPPHEYTISPVRAAVTWIWQGIVLLFAVVATTMAVRASRKKRAVTLNAALLLGFFLSFWQDPLFYFGDANATINRYALNVTSWGRYIPGWHTQHEEFQLEGVLSISVVAYFVLILWGWVNCWIVEQIARRRPHWSMKRLLLVGLLAAVIADAAIEVVWINTGIYSFAKTVPSLTLFAGHWYNLPLLQILMAAVCISFLPAHMRFAERRWGTTPFIFRGSELFSRRSAVALRLLAGIGIANLLLLAYMLLNIPVSALGGPMPADTPSYLWPSM